MYKKSILLMTFIFFAKAMERDPNQVLFSPSVAISQSHYLHVINNPFSRNVINLSTFGYDNKPCTYASIPTPNEIRDKLGQIGIGNLYTGTQLLLVKVFEYVGLAKIFVNMAGEVCHEWHVTHYPNCFIKEVTVDRIEAILRVKVKNIHSKEKQTIEKNIKNFMVP